MVWVAPIGSDNERRKTLAGEATVGWAGMPTKYILDIDQTNGATKPLAPTI